MENYENPIGFLDHLRCHFEFSEALENPISATVLLGGLIFRRNFFLLSLLYILYIVLVIPFVQDERLNQEASFK